MARPNLKSPSKFSSRWLAVNLNDLKTDRRKLASVGMTFLIIATSFYGIFNADIDYFDIRVEMPADLLADVLPSVSLRTARADANDPILLEETDPTLGLVATPVAVWYETTGSEYLRPMMYYSAFEPSKPVEEFLSIMDYKTSTVLGNIGQNNYVGSSYVNLRFAGSIEHISAQVAAYYWSSSDGVMIIECSDEGYEQAVKLVPAASYLNIPVIVARTITPEISKTLSSLGVKYSIVAGDIDGYGKVMRFRNDEDIDDFVITVLRDRLGVEPRYIAIANPSDYQRPLVMEDYHALSVSGIIKSSTVQPYPGAPPVSTDGPFHSFIVPDDYVFARAIIDVRMDISEAEGKPFAPLLANDAETSGERIYASVGVDVNRDQKLSGVDDIEVYGGSPGYEIIRDGSGKPITAWFYTEIPIINNTGRHGIQLTAKLPTDPDNEAPYSVNIIVQKLAVPTSPVMGDIIRSYGNDISSIDRESLLNAIPHVDPNEYADKDFEFVYPQMAGLSSLAPYLAAHRLGVVIADSSFQVYDAPWEELNTSVKGYPAQNITSTILSNDYALDVKNATNKMLGKLAGINVSGQHQWKELAEYYESIPVKNRIPIGIIADTLMVPQYYSLSHQGGGMEGFGMPSDNFLSDIDQKPDLKMTADPQDFSGDVVDMELPVGRIIGWDSQDTSALLARTFLYDTYVDRVQVNNDPLVFDLENYGLSSSWKDNAMTTVGTEPPVGLSRTTAMKLTTSWELSGFSVTEPVGLLSLNGERKSRRQFSSPFYESSNFIYFGVHGFHYWYMPSASEGGRFLPHTGGGSAYDVVHVKEFGMGPSVLFGSSCVTGKIDSLDPRNAISLAFIHAGANAYVGATRSSWGSIIYVPDGEEAESLGDLIGMHMYGHLTGYIYDKDGGLISGLPGDQTDTDLGVALMLAKNRYIVKYDFDGGGSDSDTINEFHLIGDPAFNPYEPNHG